jgi:DNA-binding MarR family transcriptional regulator
MGLVTRKRPSNDRRKYIISLTEKGSLLEEDALRAALNVNNEALTGASRQEIEICMRVLDLARDNLLKGGINSESEAEIDAMIE